MKSRISKVKVWIMEYFSYGQNVVALCTAIFAVLIICFVLFKPPHPGMMDFGQYDYILGDLGLSHTEETMRNPDKIYFVKLIEEYNIDDITLDRLISSSQTESIIYPVTVIGLFLQVFHIPFSTAYLAALYTLIIFFSTYIMFKSLYTLLGNNTVILSVLYIFCVLSGTNLIPLNSLYSEGAIYTFFILFISMTCRCICNCNEHVAKNTYLLLVSVLLFLTAGESMPFMVIPIIPLVIYCIWINRPNQKNRIYEFISGTILLLIVFICISHITSMPREKTKERLYSATFNGAFLYAEDQKEALDYFGIDHGFADDIGKGYYLSEEDYIVAPYLEKADTILFDKITYGRLLSYYTTHPTTFVRLMNSVLKDTKQVNREKYIFDGDMNIDGQKEQVERFDFWQLIRPFLFGKGVTNLSIYFGFMIVLLSTLIFIFKNRQKYLLCRVCYVYLFLTILCIWNFIITIFLYGNWDIKTRLFTYIILQDWLFVCTAGLIAISVKVLSAKMDAEDNQMEADNKIEQNVVELYFVKKTTWIVRFYDKVRQVLNWFDTHILGNRKYATIMIGTLATIIMVWVLFVPERIGAYNNGDFGRMMDSMGIYFTEYDLIHQDEQYVTKVVEVYDWLDNFDWATVTPISPTMSQVFLSLIVKLTAGAAGLQFSTVYTTVIYVVLMGISITAIAWSLYKLIGKKSVLLEIFLIVVLFGSYNLGWFNSLFSEATEMAGFLMVLGSGIYMIAKERGACTWKNWVVFLASARFFIGAKSQVTIEVPFLVILALVLAIYHRKDKIYKWIIQILLIGIACFFLCRSAVIIFQKDSAISSQDTVYSSIFSGILVIADDQEQALEELGLDKSLVVDAGKSTYADKSEFFCAPRTEKAEQMIYSKVNTFKVLSWYLKHPDKLWIMMNQAAKESAAVMPDYFLYVGEKTTLPHRTVSKFNIWNAIRSNVTPNTFIEYIIFYGILMILAIIQVISKKTNTRNKLMFFFYILIMCMGIVQFPLSVIGNGFTDNIKQLFVFRLIHDIVFVIALFWLFCWGYDKAKMRKEVKNDEKEEIVQDGL